VLISGEDTYISLNDIQAALDNVSGQIVRDHPSTPLLFVYFAGHGMAEGVGWNHFSIPGDMSYTGDPDKLRLDGLTRYALHAGSLADALDKLHVPYLVILDTCSEGRPARFDAPVLTPQASSGLAGVAAALRVVNEFRQESPVIFSSAPGKVVQVVQDPTDPNGEWIGPMARRLLLQFDSAAKSGHTTSLGAVVRGLATAGLDPATQPGVTHATPGSSWDGILFQPGAAPGRLVRTTGSAQSTTVCCKSATEAAQPATSMVGSVTFRGEVGEFITGGRNFTFASPATALRLTQSDDNIVIQAGGDDDGWSISFAPRKGQALKVGTYRGAQRDGFQNDGHPGLAVSSASSGCNAVAGGFTIQSIQFSAVGKIDQLSATFRQRCDDNPAWLTVSANLIAAP
jgi:hypothetical protein